MHNGHCSCIIGNVTTQPTILTSRINHTYCSTILLLLGEFCRNVNYHLQRSLMLIKRNSSYRHMQRNSSYRHVRGHWTKLFQFALKDSPIANNPNEHKLASSYAVTKPLFNVITSSALHDLEFSISISILRVLISSPWKFHFYLGFLENVYRGLNFLDHLGNSMI